jgi:hypothetical protein
MTTANQHNINITISVRDTQRLQCLFFFALLLPKRMLYIFHHIFEHICGLLAAKSRSGITDLLKENTKERRNA